MHVITSACSLCGFCVLQVHPYEHSFLYTYFSSSRFTTKISDMPNKNSLGLLKKGAAKQSRIKNIVWHLRWLVRTGADISLQPSGLVRPRNDIKLRPSRLVGSRTVIKLQLSANQLSLGRFFRFQEAMQKAAKRQFKKIFVYTCSCISPCIYDRTNPIVCNLILVLVLTNTLGSNLISVLDPTNLLGCNLISALYHTSPLGCRLISAPVLTNHLKCHTIFLILLGCLAVPFFNSFRLFLCSYQLMVQCMRTYINTQTILTCMMIATVTHTFKSFM